MEISLLGSDPLSVKISLVLSKETYRFGCHAYAVNNLKATITSPPKVDPTGWNNQSSSWEAIKASQAAWKIGIPKSLTYEQYMAQMPEGWHKTGHMVLRDLHEEVQNRVMNELHNTVMGAIGGANSLVFFPTINYEQPSRSSAGATTATVTVRYIKWLMKKGEGSFWGLPAARNPFHNKNFGTDLSIVQPIVWNRNPTNGEFIKNTRFELHPKGTGKYGPGFDIKDFVNGKVTQAPADQIAGKAVSELKAMTFTDLRSYSEELRK